MNQIAWKTHNPGTCREFYTGYSGGAAIFEVSPSLVLHEDYVVRCSLPGYKKHFDNTGSVEEMKQLAEQIFKNWLKFANLQKRTEEYHD